MRVANGFPPSETRRRVGEIGLIFFSLLLSDISSAEKCCWGVGRLSIQLECQKSCPQSHYNYFRSAPLRPTPKLISSWQDVGGSWCPWQGRATELTETDTRNRNSDSNDTNNGPKEMLHRLQGISGKKSKAKSTN